MTSAGAVDIDTQTVTLSRVRKDIQKERGREVCVGEAKQEAGSRGQAVWVDDCWSC